MYCIVDLCTCHCLLLQWRVHYSGSEFLTVPDGIYEGCPKSFGPHVKKHNTTTAASSYFNIISTNFNALTPSFLQLLYSSLESIEESCDVEFFFCTIMHLPTPPQCCKICCGWLHIITPIHFICQI